MTQQNTNLQNSNLENVLMPSLGAGIRLGVIGGWYKRAGDPVRKGEKLLLVYADRNTMKLEDRVMIEHVAVP